MAIINRAGEKAKVKPNGDILATTVIDLREQLKDLINDGVRELTVDFSEVTLIESVGLGLLIATRNTLSNKGGNLTIANANDDIKRLLSAMRLFSYFNIE